MKDEEIFKKMIERAEPFVAVADAAPDHLLLIDTEERIIFANKAMTDWWTIPREQVIGKKISDVIGHEARRVLHSYSQDVISGRPVEYDAPFLKDGHIHYFHNTYTLYRGPDGAIKGFVATGTDITKEIELKNKLMEAEERLRELER